VFKVLGDVANVPYRTAKSANMISRGFFRRMLVSAGLLLAFVATSDANWHWYYIHVHQHYQAAMHYQHAMYQHALAVHQAHAHQLAQVHHLVRAHVAVPPVHRPPVHALHFDPHHEHVKIATHPLHRRETQRHHEREDTMRVHKYRLAHHPHGHGHGRHHEHEYEGVVKTTHERWWEREIHRQIHRPPVHRAKSSHKEVLVRRPGLDVPAREHHLVHEKTAIKQKPKEDKEVVVRKQDKVWYTHGEKEWNIDLLIKVYYWTDDKLARSLPKRPKPSPKLPLTLPGDKPALAHSLITPRRGSPLKTAFSKPTQPPARSIPTAKTAKQFGKLIPGINTIPSQPVVFAKFIPDFADDLRLMDEPDRWPPDFQPLERARKPAGKPKLVQREEKPAPDKRLAMAIPRAKPGFLESRQAGDLLLPRAADDNASDLPLAIARERGVEDPPETGESPSRATRSDTLFPPLSSILLLPQVPEDADETAE
jgi:hypothetical protein